MPNFTCPYCGREAHFPPTTLWTHGRFVGATNALWAQQLQCPNPNCGGVVTASFNATTEGEPPRHIIPSAPIPDPDPLIPAPVGADLFEARTCHSVGAHKATEVMCRRALQGACVEQGANPKKSLYEQINEVVAANKVHGTLKEWADAIRLIGNSGAHVGDDGLEEV